LPSIDSVTVFVNVANAEPGSYELELQVIVPAQVQYREVNPTFVVVEIIDTTDDDELEEALHLPTRRAVSGSRAGGLG
jgi:hypothetical protein